MRSMLPMATPFFVSAALTHGGDVIFGTCG
jgi:hypothetical protein